MQLLLALLASAAVAVACLPTQLRYSESGSSKPDLLNTSVVVHPVEVIENRETRTQKATLEQQKVVPKIKSPLPKQYAKPRMTDGYRIQNQPGYGIRVRPKITTTTKAPPTTPFIWPAYDDDYPADHGHYETYKPLPLCPDGAFRCQRDCESKNFYSGYCKGNQCSCYGKLS